MTRLLMLLVALVVAFALAIFLASELGGEVVDVVTLDDRGAERTTSLWVVDRQGFAYLRAGDGDAAWVERLRQQPSVRVERDGLVRDYQAVLEPALTPEIDAMMAEKYGLADRLISLIRDPEKSLAVRLVPAS